MAYNQIYGIVNTAVKQALGANAIAVTDTSSLVSVGGQILSDETGLTLEKFMNGLVGAITKTRIKAKSYNGSSKVSMYRDADDFGLYMRKIQVDNINDAVENSSYKEQNWTYYNGSLQKNWTDRLFGKIAGLETKPTIIARKQLARCFANPAEMASFITMLDTSRMNDIKCDMESCEILARATAMIDCARSTNTLVDLGAIYNAVTGKATSSTSWLYDADLTRFCLVEMKRIMRRMQPMNRIYNNEGCDRFTDPEDLIIDLHADFVASMEGYLENTLISPFLTLPNVNEVTRWQGRGTSDGTSNYDPYKVNIKNTDINFEPDPTHEPINELELDGILCFARDRDKLALCVDDLRTVSASNNLQEMQTIVTKYDVAYAVDPSEQGIVFYVGSHNAT